jgi:hypothetical protein
MSSLVRQIAPFHTAEEMRELSNWAHWAEGAVLAVAACIALAQAAGYLRGARARYAWPAVITSAGAFLLVYLLFPHHGFPRAPVQWAFIFGDAQQRQHLLFSILTLGGGGAELLYRTGRLRDWRWQLAWPAAAVLIGVMFAAHTQHGTAEAVQQAALVHRYLGVLLVMTGLLRTADVLSGTRLRWLAISWGLTLLSAAVALGMYREPAGAYRTEHGNTRDASAGAGRASTHRDSMAGHER